MTPETATGRRLGWPAIVALALVPLLVVASLIGLARGSSDDEIHAAVVNLDEAVTIDGQMVPMGRQLAAAMLEREGDNITWTLADASSASAGLKTGDYSAVVTIPKEFSASATSFSANDAAAAKQATIQVQVSQNAPVTDAALAQEIARLATDTINSTLTESYLDGIYVGFNTVGEQFSTIVDGAAQLHEGSTQLADGADDAAQGATQLADGMQQLKDNGPQLVDGGDELVGGIGELSDGLPALQDGSTQLADGAGELADGTGPLATGMDEFADGVDEFAEQAPQLVEGVGTLAEGADELLPSIPTFADGAAQALGGVALLRDGLDEMLKGLTGPVDTSDFDQLAAGVNGLNTGLTQVDQGLVAFGNGTTPVPDQVTASSAQIASLFKCPVEDPATCGMLRQTFEEGVKAGLTGGFRAGTTTASTMLNTDDPNSGMSLLEGAAALAAGLEGIDPSAQMTELVEGVTALRDGAETIVTQSAPLVENAPLLGQGATDLNAGIQQLNDSVGELGSGVEQLSTGARQLADGAAELDGGADQLASGLDEFDDGVGQLVEGVGQLEDGAGQYVDGVSQYVDGVSSAADGTIALNDGLVQLADGAEQLDEGVGTFATELAKGAEQVPTYSAQDRERLSTVVASPVAQDDDLIASGRIPLVSLLLTVGLWLGALASFVAVRPVPRNVVSSSESSLLLWARTLWLPVSLVAAQGLVLGFLGGIVLELGIGKTFGLMGLLFAFGIAFVLVNHALAAWFGNVGRGVAAVLLAVTVALGLSSTAAWLSPVGAVSPLHNGMLLVRTWLSDGAGEVGLAGGALLMAAIAALASVMAISSRRKLTVEQYRKAA